jgi:hypothetical protein
MKVKTPTRKRRRRDESTPSGSVETGKAKNHEARGRKLRLKTLIHTKTIERQE